MSVLMDPEEREVDAMRLLGDESAVRTLEVGCGDGRLGARLLSLASLVYGIDPELGAILAAARRCDAGLRVVAGDARSLPFRDGSFDQAVFGWSL